MFYLTKVQATFGISGDVRGTIDPALYYTLPPLEISGRITTAQSNGVLRPVQVATITLDDWILPTNEYTELSYNASANVTTLRNRYSDFPAAPLYTRQGYFYQVSFAEYFSDFEFYIVTLDGMLKRL